MAEVEHYYLRLRTRGFFDLLAIKDIVLPAPIGLGEDGSWCSEADIYEEIHFYRADDRKLAEKLIRLFQRCYVEHFGISGSDRLDGHFDIVPASELDEAKRFLVDEEINNVTSIVDQYEAQWMVAEEEFGGDHPWERDSGGSPLCNEANPLSGECLCHQACKWQEKLALAPTMDFSANEIEASLLRSGADGKLSLAKNIVRMRAAAEEREKRLEALTAQPGSEPTPFDRALLRLLDSIPVTWTRMDFSRLSLSHAEEKAFNRLLEAGLVEARIECQVSMRGFPKTVRLQYRVSGDFEEKLLNDAMAALPAAWYSEDGGTKGKSSVIYDVLEARLTDAGERAKQDWNSPEPSHVLAFLRGVGPDGGGIKPKGVVGIESRRMTIGGMMGCASDFTDDHPTSNGLPSQFSAAQRGNPSEPDATPGNMPKKPSAIEMKIAEYYERSGRPQTEAAEQLNRSIAEELAKEGKFPLTQKKISDIVKKVNAWRAANKEPIIQTRKSKAPPAIDPGIITMGERVDKKSKQYRPGKSTD